MQITSRTAERISRQDHALSNDMEPDFHGSRENDASDDGLWHPASRSSRGRCQRTITWGFHSLVASLVAGLFVGLAVTPLQAQYSLEPHDAGVRVLLDGEVVADYLTKSKSKPIIWPLVGPDGVKMTRDYPMDPDSEDERHDHPHHRSLWFTHGDVNGVDFWLEGGEGGITEHQKFTKLDANDHAVVATANKWKTADGKPVLSDARRFTFGTSGDQRWVDCEFKLIASHGAVNFGDTKEGTFGLRLAESLTVDAGQGGTIVTSGGEKDRDAWGVKAEWVDYYGPLQGQTMGVAILCHPSTYNFPNRWHVRTYGLFAANPFGIHHFVGDSEPTDGMVLPEGESWTFRYRVLLHHGDAEQAKIAQQYAEFAEKEFEPLP